MFLLISITKISMLRISFVFVTLSIKENQSHNNNNFEGDLKAAHSFRIYMGHAKLTRSFSNM